MTRSDPNAAKASRWQMLVWVIITVLGCSDGRFEQFQPLKLQTGVQNKLVSAPELVTPAYLDNVRLVLEFYGERYKIGTNGALMVSAKLAKDKELLWNYSNKALDQSFISRIRTEINRSTLN